jgi:hypothetical protein
LPITLFPSKDLWSNPTKTCGGRRLCQIAKIAGIAKIGNLKTSFLFHQTARVTVFSIVTLGNLGNSGNPPLLLPY